jgi:catechol 2,3-dioxygenase-like lactoylglutathione lyase family enzyme
MILCVFDRVTIRVSDLEASRRFYDLLLGPTGEFSFDEGPPVTRHLHIGFYARSHEEVDEFWRRGVDAGYESDGEPGLRPEYSADYYGAFLLDPDGNSIEKVHHGRTRHGRIDHLWIGVADLDEQLRFWETVAPPLGLRIANVLDERFHVAGSDCSFGLVHDGRPPSEHVHLAFPVPDEETVAEFHRVAGSVGASVLDPDGNVVEAVSRNR